MQGPGPPAVRGQNGPGNDLSLKRMGVLDYSDATRWKAALEVSGEDGGGSAHSNETKPRTNELYFVRNVQSVSVYVSKP